MPARMRCSSLRETAPPAPSARAQPDGPLVAPLPGGTMNMLPRALYGTADWKVALRRALEEGAPQCWGARSPTGASNRPLLRRDPRGAGP
jgi:hypothetical protein